MSLFPVLGADQLDQHAGRQRGYRVAPQGQCQSVQAFLTKLVEVPLALRLMFVGVSKVPLRGVLQNSDWL